MNVRTKRVLPIVVFALLVGVGLLLSRPDALRGDAGGGCAVDDLTDNELARNEARYLPIEVMVTLAVGLELAGDFASYADSALAGDDVSSANCFSAEVVEETEAGGGTVRFDFTGCAGRAGVILVVKGPTPVVPAPDPDPDADPDAEPEAPVSPLFASGPADLTFTEYTASGVHLDGTLQLDSEAGSGQVATDLAVEFLDYAGTLQVSGPWILAGESGVELDLEGQFLSVTGLDWQVALADVVMDMGCAGGGLSGEMTGLYANDLGEVAARAVFDGSCDGCAAAYVNDVEQSRVCIPDDVMP
jgi:hypothetical protein